ncbi:MAG: FtsQ-type POTRA domain-containing protein [Chloroflexi bacterium]|nr:FtsQ-type POTRA domain-containing protein [Chloroflexota bacterium]
MTPDQVAHTSGVLGYSVFFVDATTVERALLKLPEIKSAQVSVSLPNSVSIAVVERQPAITWLEGSDAYWVDDDGIAIVARGSRPELVSIQDVDQTPVKPGQAVSSAAVGAYHALRDAWPAAPHTFEWSAERGLAYTDEHGWKIYLGGAAGMSGKLITLQALVPQLVAKNAKIKTIDLSKGDPFYQ